MTPEEHRELLVYARTINRGDATGRQLQSYLDAHPPVPSVPVSHLRSWQRNGWVTAELDALIRMAEPKPPLPPNPHQQGTYLWAREEAERGRSVGREPMGGIAGGFSSQYRVVFVPGGPDWDTCSWKHSDFTATDWKVVK